MAALTCIETVSAYLADLKELDEDDLTVSTLQKIRNTIPLQFVQAYQDAMTSPGAFQEFCNAIRGYLNRRTINGVPGPKGNLSKSARRDNSGEQVRQAIEPLLNLPARSLHSIIFVF